VPEVGDDSPIGGQLAGTSHAPRFGSCSPKLPFAALNRQRLGDWLNRVVAPTRRGSPKTLKRLPSDRASREESIAEKSHKRSIFLSGSSRFLAGKGVAVINAITGKPKTNNL
jgi:hypothetical protein